jgi:biopolymer transport protein ExbD
MAKRKLQEINAASMADIAFMLLIFFLVATTMDIDTGLSRQLPPMPEEDQETDITFRERNIFVVLVNKNDELQVEGEVIELSQLRDKTIEFLTNPLNDPDLPEKTLKDIEPFGAVEVTKGIISLRNDNGTSYNMYVKVLNELTAAGDYVLNQFSIAKLGKEFEDIEDPEIMKAAKDAVPVIISEAEPKNIGGD